MAVIHVHGAELHDLQPHRDAARAARAQRAARAPGARGRGRPIVCICDVEHVEPVGAVADLRPAKLLGFGSHEQPDALRAARRAGFDRVVARSAIADRLATLVDDLMI